MQYRIELGEQVSPGVFAYSVHELGISGKGRFPLLASCRDIKSMGGDTARQCALFRTGRTTPDLIASSVEYGSGLTVSEGQFGPPRFAKWHEFVLHRNEDEVD